MRRAFTVLNPRVLSTTGTLLARVTKAEKVNGASKVEAETAKNEEPTAPSPSALSDKEDGSATHVRPQAILKDVLNSVSAGQQTFLFGVEKMDTGAADGGMRATGAFFEAINDAYQGRIQQEQQVEVDRYIEKRRIHYAQRLDEQTEEFQQEQKEIHDEILRIESEKYKSELNKDVVRFTKARETEYEVQLYADVEKYFNALLAYQSRMKKSEKSKPNGSAASTHLDMKLQKVIDEMEVEGSIRDFGDAAGDGNDITDKDIRSYVVQRTCFYEKCAQDEVHDFTRSRRAFYEDLLEARAIRHAAKIRADTENYRKERQLYYENCLGNDGLWMAQCFGEHYNRCFLQAYSRKAWIEHRRYQASKEGIKIATRNGEPIPKISSPSTISVEALNEEIPLAQILDIYESENLAEVTRDVFLKAARRIANSSVHTGDGEPSS